MIPRRRPEPGLVLLAQPLHGMSVVPQPRLDQPVQIAKPPRREPKSRDTEQRIEDLTVNLEPDLARRIDVVLAGVVHSRRGTEEEEEEHGAPSDNVQAVDGHEEARGC